MTIVLGFCHPHRPTQPSAPTDAAIRTDRRRCPHRPTQTSAPTDADVRTDRRRHPHRPMHAIRGATLHAHSITTHPQQ
ncbi:hypothetical protein [Leyella stercorea]|uniref:hypothetical protein n=1 Tax=Leyella stercorea TaxID=363265 RepID=UPI00242D2E92|nr:hypothetical protein [Leyella stercorea]